MADEPKQDDADFLTGTPLSEITDEINDLDTGETVKAEDFKVPPAKPAKPSKPAKTKYEPFRW